MTTYAVQLNSWETNVTLVNQYQSVVFNNVRWDNILPFGVNRFGVTAVFKNETMNLQLPNTALVNVQFGCNINNKTQTGQTTTTLLVMQPQCTNRFGTIRSFYQSRGGSGVNEIIIDRPANLNLPIELLKTDGTPVTNMIYGWLLTLHFRPIPDDEEEQLKQNVFSNVYDDLF